MGARELAWSALKAARRRRSYVQDELHRLLRARTVSAADRTFATELALGTVRHQRTVNLLLRAVLRKPLRQLPADARLLLQSAVYQILFLDRVPDYAVVSRSVDLMRKGGQGRLAGLANAALRNVAGELDREAEPAKVTDPRRRLAGPRGGVVVLRKPLLPRETVQRLAVACSFPDFLVARWHRRWGEGRTIDVLAALNRPPRTFARVNESRETVEEVLDRLPEPVREQSRTERVNVLDLSGLPYDCLAELLAEGAVTVEDPTAMLPVEALAPEPGHRVLDLCAAPGGKTGYIAERLAGRGDVYALDRPGKRLALLRDTVKRLRLKNARVEANEPNRTARLAGDGFDRVLVDVPCTNTGVLNRRAEARWRVKPGSFERLENVQSSLLRQGLDLTCPGGVCVYSTCSIEPEENGERVRRVLAERKDVSLQLEQETLPSKAGDGGYFVRLVRPAPT